MSTEETLKHLQGLMEERDRLWARLQVSLAIQKMWPNPVWPVTPGILGSPSRGFYFRLKDRTGEERRFPLDQIPETLRQCSRIKAGLEHERRQGK